MQPEEISAIGEEMTNNKALEEEKTFSENILLFEDEMNLDEKAVDEQLYHANQVIKRIDHIDNLLADYLSGAREWRKLYQQYHYWKKFYDQVNNFANAENYYEQHQIDKNILDRI